MIPIFSPSFGEAERANLLECIDSGWISSQGQFIGDFESAFAESNGMLYGVTTSNCTTALHLALCALKIGPGDEVICADLTFISPVNMIALTGARPVLVDVEATSWAMQPALVEAAITAATKAIIVVHPFGHAADMDPIIKIAEHHGIKIIEDVAEAPGAKYKGRILGSFGHVSCFSFFANKVITTGEGGIVLTSDSKLDTLLRTYRDHGMSRERRYHHVVSGFNYRMTNMQAAIGLAQLERFEDITIKRRAQENRYRGNLNGHQGLALRPVEGWCEHIHWLMTLTVPDPSLRNSLLNHLNVSGIDGRQMIFPVHAAEPYKDKFPPNAFPVSRNISFRSMHLPSSTDLGDDEIDQICESVLAWADREI